jgi:hypothetical protein
VGAERKKMISPSFGFKVRDYGRLSAAGMVIIGRSFLEIGKIALGITVMWLIVIYGMVAFPFRVFLKFISKKKVTLL